MTARPEAELDVTAYAALAAALAEPGCRREAVLAARGLDEAAWAGIDDAWQARLSAAMEEETDGIPPLVAAYAEAFAAAQREAGGQGLPLERFAEATREIQRHGDPTTTLARLGIPLAAYLQANAHWTRRIVEDRALAERFRRALKVR
jgi:hypothetical protein